MKTCQVQSRPDRSVGKHVSCGKPAKFIAKYRPFETNNPDYYQHPAHMVYMCTEHAEMAADLQKVDFNSD